MGRHHPKGFSFWVKNHQPAVSNPHKAFVVRSCSTGPGFPIFYEGRDHNVLSRPWRDLCLPGSRDLAGTVFRIRRRIHPKESGKKLKASTCKQSPLPRSGGAEVGRQSPLAIRSGRAGHYHDLTRFQCFGDQFFD